MARGLDYSWGRPNLAQVKAAGYDFVIRYLAEYGGGKEISQAEAQQIRNAKLGLALVYEQRANNALGGRAAGKHDAQVALKQAEAIGFPDDRPIYFAVDWDATPAQQGVIDEYLRGAAEVIGAGRVGVYGGYWICKRCKENGSAKWFWQTYAWSGGNKLDGMHIYQYLNGQNIAGAEVDLNETFASDYGAWTDQAPSTHVEQPAKPEPARPVTDGYRIQKGDTFWDLEKAHGWAHGTLQQLNPTVEPRELQIGQLIRVPSMPSQAPKPEPSHMSTYKIKQGDTFWGLETANGWTHGTLQSMNPSVKPKELGIGQTINVPAGGKPAASNGTKWVTVQENDTLSLIARDNNMSLAAIESLNPNAGHPAGNFDLIRPGDRIRVR